MLGEEDTASEVLSVKKALRSLQQTGGSIRKFGSGCSPTGNCRDDKEENEV